MTSLRKALKIVLIALLILLLLASMLLLLPPLLERRGRTDLQAQNWMEGIDGSRSLASLTIPGAHDAAASEAQLAFFARCQYYGIYDLLQTGVRYLDIRLGQVSSDSMILCHGFCPCRTGPFPWSETLTLDHVLQDCIRFLGEHPSETILFAVKQEHGSQSVAEFEACLDRILSQNESFWLFTDTIPTLEQARGKLVLLRRYADEAGLGLRSGIDLRWDNQPGSADSTLHAAFETAEREAFLVQDRYEYTVKEKWTAFLAADAAAGAYPEDTMLLNFLSTKGHLPQDHPFRFAGPLNKELSAYLDAGGTLRGWIPLDFAEPSLVGRVWALNFI